ncbi:DUF6777 domain-containing protein [Streptomyces corynorhini]|uniref:DUF6777 domain-containing protein n=1 Tax=Streptomyces corynorhini TaxID=2282652 RepID=A0A370B0U3_9ACTN|nr:DUF6777 domain-containing protein [Streptomyces corynorhini]RDG35527.1 hypothetical protein DVH02_24775 [Streptomyces corynorhini]
MRSLIRRRYAVLAALSAGVLATAGCGIGGGSGAGHASDAKELYLQPARAAGPDPFTAAPGAGAPGGKAAPSSTPEPGTLESRTPEPRTSEPRTPRSGSPRSGRQEGRAGSAPAVPRALPGSTPGLYGASTAPGCAVERQARLLAKDPAKARSFARAAGIGKESVPDFLRALTPVELRADVRVTDHGHRAGAATAFQAVLQSGTAVLVDGRGLPRVRCASGNPLGPPVAFKGSVDYRGERWPGYRAERVVVVQRSEEDLGGLVIVDPVDGVWVERRSGTDGGEDIAPAVLPAYGPDADLSDPEVVKPPDALLPGEPPASATPSADAPAPGRPPVDRRRAPETGAADPGAADSGSVPPADELFGPLPDGQRPGEAAEDVLVGPDAFQG